MTKQRAFAVDKRQRELDMCSLTTVKRSLRSVPRSLTSVPRPLASVPRTFESVLRSRRSVPSALATKFFHICAETRTLQTHQSTFTTVSGTF